MSRAKSISFPNSENEMSNLFDKLQRAVVTHLLNSGGLAIHGSASAVAKIANTIFYMIDGQVYTKTTADTSVLAGTVTNAKFNVFVFTINAAGTFHTYMGTESATLGGVAFPAIPEGEVSVGFVIVNPTGTGNFVGGTTALDDGTVVPNAAYVNTVSPFFPQYQAL